MDVKAKDKMKLQLTILRAQAGDEIAFRELFDLFKGTTFRHIRKLLNQADAEDVQQQVWFSAYQQLNKLSSPFGFSRWLMTIAHRKTINCLRKQNQQSSDNIADEIEEITDTKQSGADKENVETIHRALKRLPLISREVIALHYWHDFSCSEISQILGCSTGTVKSRLHKGRQQLARLNLSNILNEEQ